MDSSDPGPGRWPVVGSLALVAAATAIFLVIRSLGEGLAAPAPAAA
ncbi:MAG: hypothetical protein AB1505_28695 [Candidatus Latescibacterota bacterium]